MKIIIYTVQNIIHVIRVIFIAYLPYSGMMTSTSNFGKTYSATRKDCLNSCPETSTVMFQSPITGASASFKLAAKTPEKSQLRH